MALSRTTLSAAVAASDVAVTLAAITGLQVGDEIVIDGEVMRVSSVGSAATVPVGVIRGVRGTAVKAHPVTAGVAYGPPADHSATVRSASRKREIASYTAAGAIALPTPGNDAVAILNGTSALAMTLADPAKDNDGDILYIVGNGKAAHTVTYTAGLGDGGSGLDVGTFDTNAQCCMAFVAANETWVPLPSPLSGTLTGCDVAVA